MSDTIKFTEDELKSIQEIQTTYNQVTMAMGQLSISKLSLDDREKNLISTLAETRTKEQELAKDLNDKYGRGSLDIKSGEFTPTPAEEATEEATEIVEATS
tara:strand:- start:208 stop:510 length:303 start_codon:yes stop_codon:yes gene_type:complete